MSFSGRERNRFFLSQQGKSFLDLSYLSGLDSVLDGRAFAYSDMDRDGDQDLILVSRNAPILRIFENNLVEAGRNHWVGLKLAGNGMNSNRDAIGSRVESACKGRRWLRHLSGGEGFSTQNSKTLHLGLGDCKQVETLSVTWPNGKKRYFKNVAVGRVYAVGEEGPLRPVMESGSSFESVGGTGPNAESKSRKAPWFWGFVILLGIGLSLRWIGFREGRKKTPAS